MTAAPSSYRADIDGLRAVAVSTVLLYHAFPQVMPGGFVGVDVFFVISGYLISGIILSSAREQRFSLTDFYARRIKRIFPALSTILAAVLAAGWFALYADDYARLGEHVAAGAAFLANIELWNESSYFDVGADLKPLLHLWSLGIEEQFYLVWPLVLAVAARWKRVPLAATMSIAAASFIAAIVTVRTDPTAAFYSPWTRFWELLVGAMLACSVSGTSAAGWLEDLQASGSVHHAITTAGAGMIAAALLLITAKSTFPGYWALLPVLGAALVIAAGPRAWINRVVLSHPAMVWVGAISYPLYLWHWPLLSFAKIVTGGLPAPAIRASLLAVAVVLSWATYRLLERPVRFTLPTRVVLAPLAVTMALMLAAGLTVSARQGFIERPVNRNDAARLVDYYDRMYYHTLGAAYRFECDFNDRDTNRVRQSLPESCLERGSQHTIMLWGDSFAQALSLGLRENLPPGTSLAQVATSACRAQTEDFDTSVEDNRCEIADRYAMQQIARLKPDIVILAQNAEHLDTDWAALTGKILELGAGQVVIVGPSPMWDPTLPRVYASRHMQDHAQYVADGLNTDGFDVDRQLAERIGLLPRVRYVSLLKHLCKNGACLAVVPGGDPLDLLAIDYGHLSPKGSSYIGATLFKPLLPVLLAPAR